MANNSICAHTESDGSDSDDDFILPVSQFPPEKHLNGTDKEHRRFQMMQRNFLRVRQGQDITDWNPFFGRLHKGTPNSAERLMFFNERLLEKYPNRKKRRLMMHILCNGKCRDIKIHKGVLCFV